MGTEGLLPFSISYSLLPTGRAAASLIAIGRSDGLAEQALSPLSLLLHKAWRPVNPFPSVLRAPRVEGDCRSPCICLAKYEPFRPDSLLVGVGEDRARREVLFRLQVPALLYMY